MKNRKRAERKREKGEVRTVWRKTVVPADIESMIEASKHIHQTSTV